MSETISPESMKYVQSGELVIALNNELLFSSPLGSCIAVIAYDKQRSIGGMSHVLLPWNSPVNGCENENKYAGHAVDNLLKLMADNGCERKNLEFCLAGGANVLKRPNDSIARDMCHSIRQLMANKHLSIKAESLGGFQRRIVVLNTKLAKVCLEVGDEEKKDFCYF